MWAVINNAGIAAFAEAEWCSLDAYQNMMDVNWMGTVRVTKTFLPLVRAARGRIINVVSLAGKSSIINNRMPNEMQMSLRHDIAVVLCKVIDYLKERCNHNEANVCQLLRSYHSAGSEVLH